MTLRFMFLPVAVFALSACPEQERGPGAPPAPPPPVAAPAKETPEIRQVLRDSEDAAMERNARRVCEGRVSLFEGSVTVAGKDYMTVVKQGEDYVDAPISDVDLNRVLSRGKTLRFVLDYPFEKPFQSSIDGAVTLRRLVDAIRAGFRTMYEGAVVKDIPKMMNKDVQGRFGRAFHSIDDLVIESIDLCRDGSLEIGIGS